MCEYVIKKGCCQEIELFKSWACALIDYEVVVHLDLDALVMQSMDELFDAMVDWPDYKKSKDNSMSLMFNAKLPKKIDACFTRDYDLLNSPKKNAGTQRGFFVTRPSDDAFEEHRQVFLEGNFVAFGGWGGFG